MTALLFAVGLACVTAPLVLRRIGRKLHPSEWVRLMLAAVTAGCVVVELALLLTALPTVTHSVGLHTFAVACRQALRLNGPRVLVGWSALVLALVVPVLAARSWHRSRRAARSLEIEPWLGQHAVRRDVELVIVPTNELLAYSVAGAGRQVVVSEGVVSSLTTEQLDVVVRHELAHLDHDHQALLFTLTAIEGACPLVRACTRPIRTGIERWADELAAANDPAARSRLSAALLRLAQGPEPVPAVPSFNGHTIAERILSLAVAAPAPRPLDRFVARLYVASFGLAGMAVMTSQLLQTRASLALFAFCGP